MSITEQFKNYIQDQHLFHPKDRLLLTVSGGVDSVVLCELCKQAGYDFAIAHCNFKLREADSDRDEQFVQNLAQKYAVPFFVQQFDTAALAKAGKKSVEETARNLRYAWFEEIRAANGYAFIVTAHHANDQVETVLMNFFRGTGLKGLHGIPPKRDKIVRPMLFAKKNELLAFAVEHALAFVQDHTNAQNDFTRNYFRNEIIPAVQKVFPAVEDNLLNNISRLSEAEALYNEAIALHKKKLLEVKGTEVHIPVLKLLQLQPLHSILYEIIKAYGFSSHQTAEVAALLQSESGKYVESATHRIIRNRKWLIITTSKTEHAAHILIEPADKLVKFEGGLLKLSRGTPPSSINTLPSMALLDADAIQFPLLLRKWKPGDYFYPLGMQKKKKLARFLIDQKLSIAGKEKVWVLESNKKILWVIGMRIDDRFKIGPAVKNVLQVMLTAE
ncbi:MAG: tRNA lysidine(34) synthetase TilS [Ferruginibacter sp.]